MRVSFLLNNGFGLGGTVTAVFTLARALSDFCEVEIVSVFKRSPRPILPVPDRVAFGFLLDLRSPKVTSMMRTASPSTLIPAQEEYFRQYSEASDKALRSYATHSRADVLVATRPGLAIALAGMEGRPPLLVQMHHLQDSVSDEVNRRLVRSSRLSQGVVAVSRHETRSWTRLLANSGVPVRHIGNPVASTGLPLSDQTDPVIFGVGRLEHSKRFDLLIQAFSLVSEQYPQWKLVIFGDGPEHEVLLSQAVALGLAGRVDMAGRVSNMGERLVQASIIVSASEFESFGMTLIEGMSAGLAVISSDCLVGPRELIDDQQNGLLFPVGDAQALARCLSELMSSRDERLRLGGNGSRFAAQFSPEMIAAQYWDLLKDVAGS